jgi:TAG lipase/steryl ester hydrolase/phospholipase A2/LPA acyltransferase
MYTSPVKKAALAMQNATSYEQWSAAAQDYDQRSGLYRWQIMDQSRSFDYVSIRIRLDRLRALRSRHDDQGLLTALNEGIHGNMGGMGKLDLYTKAKFSTKQLIVNYVDEIVDALEHLASDKVTSISFEDKLDFFRRAHHCFGRSALMMSGSGSLLYFHIGVIKALKEQNLLPSVLSGSSGGSIVGSLVSTLTSEELTEVFDPEMISFKSEPESVLMTLAHKIQPKTMQASEVKEIISSLIPDLTFQEAFEKTGRHMNVSVAPVETHQTSRLLNAFTSPNVYIREAIMASAAVPGIYPPVTLMAKGPDGDRQAYLPTRKWVDGSVSDDLPAKRLARLYGVNHYIVSQTNPHVLPFVTDAKRENDVSSIIRNASKRMLREWLNASAEIIRRPFKRNQSVNRLLNMTMSIINQDYVGDINILPPTVFFNPLRLLSHRSTDEIKKLISMGERATWPKIEMVRVQTKIGRTLDNILHEYEHDYISKVQAVQKMTKTSTKVEIKAVAQTA